MRMNQNLYGQLAIEVCKEVLVKDESNTTNLLKLELM